MLVDRPASPFAGHTWYLFDQVWRYPVTRVPGSRSPTLDLSKYNVLDPSRRPLSRPARRALRRRLKDWVRGGGTLILVKGAAAWATEKSVGLLASKPVKKVVKSEPEPKPEPEKKAAEKGEKPPVSTEPKAGRREDGRIARPRPGAFLRASVYDDHFVTFGSPAEIFPSDQHRPDSHPAQADRRPQPREFRPHATCSSAGSAGRRRSS